MTRTSISDFEGIYLEAVRAALDDEEAFAAFRRLPGIVSTIENVSPAWGAEYRSIALRQTPQLMAHLERFRSSDTVGRPDTAPFPEGMMSPTTWRYIKVVSDLTMLFGDLRQWDVVEIGAGYGGQCKIISDVYDVSSYTIYDLEPVARLAGKFLQRMVPAAAGTVRFADFRRLADGTPRTYDLVISNWALSECTRQIQDLYIEHVLRRSRRGYITYNQISQPYGIDSYTKPEIVEALGFPAQLIPEGLSVRVPEEREFFVLHWQSQPFLD